MIPAPTSWNRADAHDAHDDCADWACEHMPRLVEADLDRRIAEKQTGLNTTEGGANINTAQPIEAASAVSGIGFENEPAPRRPRLGPLTSIERRLLRRTPTYTWAFVTALAFVCFVQWVRA